MNCPVYWLCLLHDIKNGNTRGKAEAAVWASRNIYQRSRLGIFATELRTLQRAIDAGWIDVGQMRQKLAKEFWIEDCCYEDEGIDEDDKSIPEEIFGELMSGLRESFDLEPSSSIIAISADDDQDGEEGNDENEAETTSNEKYIKLKKTKKNE